MVGCATVPAPRLLRLHPAVGATQTLAVAVELREHRASGGALVPDAPPLRLQINFDAKVDAVAPVTGIHYTLGNLEVSLLGDSAAVTTAALVEQLADHMDWAEYVTGDGAVSDRGALERFELRIADVESDDEVTTTLKRSSAKVIAAVEETLALAGIPFPDGAVEPGASWSGEGTVRARGVEARRQLTYQLVEVDEHRARVHLVATLTGAELDARFEGELLYDYGLPLPIAGKLRGKLALRTHEAGREGTMTIDSDLRLGAP